MPSRDPSSPFFSVDAPPPGGWHWADPHRIPEPPWDWVQLDRDKAPCGKCGAPTGAMCVSRNGRRTVHHRRTRHISPQSILEIGAKMTDTVSRVRNWDASANVIGQRDALDRAAMLTSEAEANKLARRGVLVDDFDLVKAVVLTATARGWCVDHGIERILDLHQELARMKGIERAIAEGVFDVDQ